MTVKALSISTYKRHIKTKPVTFDCHCTLHQGPRSVTEERYPGALPRICLVCKETGRYRIYRHQRLAELARIRRQKQD